MRPEIPQTLKSIVIQLYLQAFSRNEIASRTRISQGAVSNIIAAEIQNDYSQNGASLLSPPLPHLLLPLLKM